MSQLSNITQEIYNNANNEFQKSFPGFQFSEAQAMLPGLNLLKTPTHTEKRKANRMAATKFKKSVECHKKETSVLKTFGTELSLSKRNKSRMVEFFETPQQCKERSFKEREKVESEKERKKVHVPSNIPPWNEDECLQTVRSYPEGYNINFSDLARQFGIKNSNGEVQKNAGQIVKGFLEENGIDLFNYQHARKGYI